MSQHKESQSYTKMHCNGVKDSLKSHGIYHALNLQSSTVKVENILKGNLDLIQSPSPSVKIQIMGGKVCLRCRGKTLLGVVNKLLKCNANHI